LIFRKRSSSLLDEFEQAKAEVVANPAVSPIWVSKVKGYPPGILRACQQTIQLAQEKVETWLASYRLRAIPRRVPSLRESPGGRAGRTITALTADPSG